MMNKPPPQDNQPFGIKANLWLLKMARNWLNIVLVFLTFYVGLSVVAPVLMKAGAERPARVIYKLYSPMCHQFAFRSFFLFGEQHVYPRENTGTNLRPFETYARDLPEFEAVDFSTFDLALITSAREFIGNEQMGYKIALCERDLAIYTALLIGGLIYKQPEIRRRLRPAPIWLYIFLGLGPVGLDGLSQLLGYPPFELWPERETLPIFRVVTGALFGLMSAWLAYPYFNESMEDTEYQIKAKLWRAGMSL